MIICPFCKKCISSRNQLSRHFSTIEKNNFSSELEKELKLVNILFGEQIVKEKILLYKEGKVCANDLKKEGFEISKLLNLMGIKRSSKEERKTSRYKEKYTNSIFEKYGVDNISKNKEIQAKKEQTLTLSYGSYDKYLETCREQMKKGFLDYLGTPEHLATNKKRKQIFLKKYGVDNPMKVEAFKDKSKENQKIYINSLDYEERLEKTRKARESISYISNIEKRVRIALTSLDIDFKSNVFLWNYNYDLLFGKYIIEVQGDFWHANPTKYKENDILLGKWKAKDVWEKDKRKKDKAESKGYTIIEIWEHEINKKSDEELIEFVKLKLKEFNYEFLY